jgi:hypothetical protein
MGWKFRGRSVAVEVRLRWTAPEHADLVFHRSTAGLAAV